MSLKHLQIVLYIPGRVLVFSARSLLCTSRTKTLCDPGQVLPWAISSLVRWPVCRSSHLPSLCWSWWGSGSMEGHDEPRRACVCQPPTCPHCHPHLHNCHALCISPSGRYANSREVQIVQLLPAYTQTGQQPLSTHLLLKKLTWFFDKHKYSLAYFSSAVHIVFTPQLGYCHCLRRLSVCPSVSFSLHCPGRRLFLLLCSLVFCNYKDLGCDFAQICSPEGVDVQFKWILDVWSLIFMQLPFSVFLLSMLRSPAFHECLQTN